MPRVCFLVTDFGPSGGVAVIVDHAQRLREHGLDIEIASSAEDVRDGAYDVAVSTWWETTPLLWQVSARRRVAFLQSAEECFYRGAEAADRLGAALAMRAADEYVVVSEWLAELIRGVRPGATVRVVPNGVDKQVFDGRRPPRGEGPLRVLVEGQPSVWFKGVQAAVAAVRGASAPVELTVVSPEPEAGAVPEADRSLAGLTREEMARLYGETDLVVKLSRLEGLGLVPIEAFHHGVPCIVTPYGGHSDYVRHGVNGFVAGFDDQRAVTQYVDRIAADEALWQRLSEGAFATAAEWPDVASSTELFAEALRAPGQAAPEAAVSSMLDAWRLAAEQDRGWRTSWEERTLAETRGALEGQIAEVERLNAHVDELEQSRLHVRDLLVQREAELEAVKATRAYRVAVAARSLVRRTDR